MMDGSALPSPGDTVAGKYVLERVIGEGGMSVVYGATHRVTGKRFAIKWMLPDETATSSDTARRFIREAQVAGLFQHPNAVEVYDVGQVSGSFYMVMEWLDGESLASRLERNITITFQDMCAYLIPCMHGVTEAHAAGIVHRDLKPANIFLCRAMHHTPERPKVLDFGIAKISKQTFDVNSLVTKSGVLIGTPHYLSPEQLRSLPVDHRTDIYAFGVIMYQLLSGQLPFPADNFGQLVLQIATGTPVPLRDFVPGLPAGMPELVARAMAREPQDRFQDLRELIGALEGLAAGVVPLSAAGHPNVERRTPTPRSGLTYPVNTPRPVPPPLPSRTPSQSGPVQLSAAEAGAALVEPAPRSRRAWTYAAVAAVVVGACLVLARIWLVQPQAADAEKSASGAPPKAATHEKETTASAATTTATSPAATAALPDGVDAPRGSNDSAESVGKAQVRAGAEQTSTASPAARVKRPVRASPPAPAASQPFAAPAPEPAPVSATPAPLDRNPLHMKLQ
jgi:serine/threonine protein kinase